MKRTGSLVQVVDILRAEIEAIAHPVFERSQRAMRCVGLRIGRVASAHRVETPHEFWIGLPGFGCRNFLYPMSIPEATGSAKGCEAALGGYARASEHKESVLSAEAHKRLLPLRAHNCPHEIAKTL
jgi:hypothetical protein